MITIYNSKNGVADIYYDQDEMQSCSKSILEKVFDPSIIEKLRSDSKMENDKLLQVANDLDTLKYGGLPDEIVFKVYEILLNQYIEVCKYSNIINAAGKDQNLNQALSQELARIKAGVDEAISKAESSSSKLFKELSYRSGKKEDHIKLMNPEEIKYALYTGKMEDWEIEGRMNHFLVLYDLEKDDPIVYTLEKARVMELLFKFEKGNNSE